MTNFCFGGAKKDFIGIIKYDAIRTNSQKDHRLPFNKTTLTLAINYLLDNCYFSWGSTCLCQLIRISMESNHTPFMVNLLLYYYKRCLLQIKIRISERLVCFRFQVFFGFQMTFALSIMISLKIIKKNEDFLKPLFQTF